MLIKVLQGSLVSISWSFALVVVGSVDVCEVCFIVHFSDLPIGNFMSPVLVLANKNSLLMASASAHRLQAAVICWWVSMVELIGLWRWSCLVDRSIELMADGSRIFFVLSRVVRFLDLAISWAHSMTGSHFMVIILCIISGGSIERQDSCRNFRR